MRTGHYTVTDITNNRLGSTDGALQGTDHLVVLTGNLSHLGKGLDRHFTDKMSITLMRRHGIKQINQFGTRAMLRDVQTCTLVFSRNAQRHDPIQQSQQQPGHTKGPYAGYYHALALDQ